MFWGITLPLAKGSVLTAALLTFTHTVGEFGVVLMLGGNIPGATRTMSIALYDAVQDGRYGDANRTAGILLGVAFAGLVGLYWRRGRGERGWRCCLTLPSKPGAELRHLRSRFAIGWGRWTWRCGLP